MAPPAHPADPATAEAIGEIRGQLREMIHNQNNDRQWKDAVSKTLTKLDDVPDKLTKIEERLGNLEIDKHRREGRDGMMVMLLKSPLMGWLVGAATTVWALVTGRLHL